MLGVFRKISLPEKGKHVKKRSFCYWPLASYFVFCRVKIQPWERRQLCAGRAGSITNREMCAQDSEGARPFTLVSFTRWTTEAKPALTCSWNALGYTAIYTHKFTVSQVLTVRSYLILCLGQGCQTHFHWGPHRPHNCLQRTKIISGLYKCNCSLTAKELKLHLALWRQPRGWCGPRWKWVWHPWLRVLNLKKIIIRNLYYRKISVREGSI